MYTTVKENELTCSNHMTKNPKLLFYVGFSIFLLGHFSELVSLEFLEFLQIVGSLIALGSIVLWFMTPNFSEKFKREKGEDALTYFWNKIVIRLWSGMFLMFMWGSTLTYLLRVVYEW